MTRMVFSVDIDKESSEYDANQIRHKIKQDLEAWYFVEDVNTAGENHD